MSAVNLCCKNVLFWSVLSRFLLLSSHLLLVLPLTENWQYIHTECANGWWPHNGFCYWMLSETEAGSWEESSRACGSHGANLTSLHSLSDVEMLLNLLTNCKYHGPWLMQFRYMMCSLLQTLFGCIKCRVLLLMFCSF